MAWLRLWASRDFTASAPNVKYVGDITYLPLATGTNLYLATVIDCCSRRVAGWAIAEHMRTELVADAWRPLHWISAVSSCVELSVSWVFCCVIGWDVSGLGRWPWGLRRGRRAGS